MTILHVALLTLKYLKRQVIRQVGYVIIWTALVFVGDTLFRDSVGRTDFPNGSYETLMESIKTQLYKLPDNTMVYPGHGPETNIGYEKQYNPFVGV